MRRGVRLSLEQLAPYLLALPNPPALLDFPAIFGNDRPVEIEVGFGKGLFLLTAASARPDLNYLGVEIERAYQLFAANRLAKRGLINVRLACGDARAFFCDCLRPGSAQAVHVYFPDPWWKRRHHKRRLWTPDFAAHCERIVRIGGKLHIATDVVDYFDVITSLLASQRGLRLLPPPALSDAHHDLDYLTNYERKARKVGKRVFRALYERVEDVKD